MPLIRFWKSILNVIMVTLLIQVSFYGRFQSNSLYGLFQSKTRKSILEVDTLIPDIRVDL